MTEEEKKTSLSSWGNRVVLVIPRSQLKKLKKEKRAQVMKDKRWYELVPDTAQSVYNAHGVELTKAQIRSILRRM